MKKAFLSRRLLEPGLPLSNIVRGILILKDADYDLYTDSIKLEENLLVQLLKNENVEIKYGTDEDTYDLVFTNDETVNATKVDDEADFAEIVRRRINVDSARTAEISRNTKETQVYCAVNLDGDGKAEINTGIGFFDHMLAQIARHGNIDLEIIVKGDLDVDEHHTVEDTGLALGEAISRALGNKMGIRRYGFLLPMDDSVAEVAVDLGGRPYINFKTKFKREKIGEFPTELVEEFFRAISVGMKANIYIKAKGKNEHHKIESIFKAFAKALNDALAKDERSKNKLPSTKGVL